MAKYEPLTFKSEIDKRMAEIAAARPTFLVGFGQYSESAEITTSVVDFDIKKRIMGISSLRGKDGKPVNPVNNQFHVVTSINGLAYRFMVKLRHAASCNGVYEFNFPETFEYLQRRAYYRVPLQEGDANVALDVGNVRPVVGSLQDISVAGMRVKAKAQTGMSLNVGDPVTLCKLNLSGHDNIRFSATLRYKEAINDEQYILGFVIDEIDNAHQNVIERYVALRDLEIRKQRMGM